MASSIDRHHDHRQGQQRQSAHHNKRQAIPRQDDKHSSDFPNDHRNHEDLSKEKSLNNILDRCRMPPMVNDMSKVNDAKTIFMISPFKYDPSFPARDPQPISNGTEYVDQWDQNHVQMPCSPKLLDKNRKAKWSSTIESLSRLRKKCDAGKANIDDLKTTIESCAERHYNMECLEIIISQRYSSSERTNFLSIVLSKICRLAMDVGAICGLPPPLLHSGKPKSVTMSQKQAASLLACAFFCLFPHRSEHDQTKDYENFQNPNFNKLYQRGPPEKIEKLRCILHYFHRIEEKMPTGVISFRRFVLTKEMDPNWSKSSAPLSGIHITSDKKIEDISCTLQVDFANKYIGGGVLGSGCVQEEIRFSICPEMLVSLLVCEVMDVNECIFLIGCERYCSYEGYGGSFKFAGNYVDDAPKDNWGRKWCHLLAIDAIFFREREAQYDMKHVTRELTKAFTGFRPRASTTGAENLFGIATGHWGCGAFNGDKQLKAIIQLMAASEAQRPLIYAAYGDRNFVHSFGQVYAYLTGTKQKATVSDLYRYIQKYCALSVREPLFDYILHHPIDSIKH